jgi:hypothetical protein
VEKYGTARQATDDNIILRMRFACWITKATDTLRICNTSCFPTATMVTRKRLNITFIRALPLLFGDTSGPRDSSARNPRLGMPAAGTYASREFIFNITKERVQSKLSFFDSFTR